MLGVEGLIPGNRTRSLANRAYLLFGALTVIPLFIFLAAAPLHVTDTGAGKLFFTIALGANLISFNRHDHTSNVIVLTWRQISNLVPAHEFKMNVRTLAS